MLEDYYEVLDQRSEETQDPALLSILVLVREELYAIVEAAGYLLETPFERSSRTKKYSRTLKDLLKSVGLSLPKKGGNNDKRSNK